MVVFRGTNQEFLGTKDIARTDVLTGSPHVLVDSAYADLMIRQTTDEREMYANCNHAPFRSEGGGRRLRSVGGWGFFLSGLGFTVPCDECGFNPAE